MNLTISRVSSETEHGDGSDHLLYSFIHKCALLNSPKASYKVSTNSGTRKTRFKQAKGRIRESVIMQLVLSADIDKGVE
jgi:hypothetical protein